MDSSNAFPINVQQSSWPTKSFPTKPMTYMHSHLTEPWHKQFRSNNSSPVRCLDDRYTFDDMKRRFDEDFDCDMRHFRSDTRPLPSFHSLKPNKFFSLSQPSRSHSYNNLNEPDWSTFERDANGQVQFVATFNLSTYDPDQIKVLIRNDDLIITSQVKQLFVNNNRANFQYKKTVKLPPGVQEEKVSSHLSDDGMLTVVCPIKPPPYLSILRKSGSINDLNSAKSKAASPHRVQFSDERQFNRPESDYSYRRYEPQQTSFVSSSPYAPIKHSNYDYGTYKSKPEFYVEIPVDNEYLPTEIKIETFDQRIQISGHHEEMLVNRRVVREFNKEYDIPLHINPQSLSAKLINGRLVIESK